MFEGILITDALVKMLDIIWAFLAARFAALRCLDKERVEVVTSGALLDLVFVLVFVLKISTRCRSCTYLSPKGKEIDFGEI